MHYYVPCYKTKNMFSVREVMENYLKKPNPNYLFEYLMPEEEGLTLLKWEEVSGAVNKKDGVLLNFSDWYPKTPETLFELEGAIKCFLNGSNEVIFRKTYGNFQISKIYSISWSIMQLKELKPGSFYPKTHIATQDENEFQRKLEKWISRNQLRYEIRI